MTTRLTAAAAAVVAAAFVVGNTAHPADAVTVRSNDVAFSGNGGKSLPPFTVQRGSTLYWRAGGDIFQLFSSGIAGGSVNSQAGSGWTYLATGRYQYDVNAIGNWSIRVVEGKVVHPASVGSGLVGYRGNGGMDLPPVKFGSARSVGWRASGGIFQLFDDNLMGGANVNSQATSGTTYARSGTHRWTVNALGGWVVGWRP
jgi:hypothetical protein